MSASSRCTRSVVLVAGLGNKVANFAPLAGLGVAFERNGYQISHVDGASYKEGILVATSPDEQMEQILDQVRSADRPLIIAHSIGSLAAVSALRQRPDARAVVIGPPLPKITPKAVALFMSRVTVAPDGYLIPSHSFAPSGHGFGQKSAHPATVKVQADYFRNTTDKAVNLLAEVSELAQDHKLRIVNPVDDWNQRSVEFARSIPGTLDVKAPHSLYVPPEQWPAICRSIYECATQDM